jgi:hypothetical protein
VLIDAAGHHVSMFVYFLIAVIVLVGPLACLAGTDSRIDENERRRRYFG